MSDGSEWRPVVGYEGAYEVSDDGRVRSLPRPRPKNPGRGGSGMWRGRMLTFAYSKGGYRQVHLSARGYTRTVYVHHLVLEAFVGPRPADMPHTRHLDGDQTNNVVGNLAYGTISQNMLDQVKHGTHWAANRTHCPRGHPYAGENLIFMSNGGRACRTCARERHRKSGG